MHFKKRGNGREDFRKVCSDQVLFEINQNLKERDTIDVYISYIVDVLGIADSNVPIDMTEISRHFDFCDEPKNSEREDLACVIDVNSNSGNDGDVQVDDISVDDIRVEIRRIKIVKMKNQLRC